MAKKMTPVDVSFFDTARVRRDFTVRIEQPIERVFGAIADPATWDHWFPNFKPTGYYVDPSVTFGASRIMNVAGKNMTETVIAWDAPTRWAFTLVEGGIPGTRSLAEDYRLAADGTATVLTWTMAMDMAPAAAAVAGLLMGPVGGRMIKKAAKNLESYLNAS